VTLIERLEAEWPITPTPADRETYIAFNNLPGVHLAEVRAGKWDNTTGMQIIARHAQAARLEGALAMQEAAAKVVNERAEACRMAGVDDGIDPIEAQILDEHLSEAAEAIRDLDPLSIAEKGV
jgi:hypothetical protein